MPEPIRLLLIDYPTLSRRGVAALLTRRRGVRVVGEPGNGAEARVLARALRPDVIVVDTRVAGGGTRLVADLRRELPRSAVLVLTQDSGWTAATSALQAGARGYIQKSCEPDDLVRTIQRIHLGELVVASAAADRTTYLGHDDVPGSALTVRELEVLRLVARGRTNPGIAHDLAITEHTAKEHLTNILDKLGLENRVQIATYAVQHGLGPVADAAV
jgi:two-component system nitrate/nitrite response regulator NarL